MSGWFASKIRWPFPRKRVSQYNLGPTVLATMIMGSRKIGMKVFDNKDHFLEIKSLEQQGQITKSGLQKGDELIKINTQNVVGWSVLDFMQYENNIKLGKKIKILVYRGRQKGPAPAAGASSEEVLEGDSASSSAPETEFALVHEYFIGQAAPDPHSDTSDNTHPDCDAVIPPRNDEVSHSDSDAVVSTCSDEVSHSDSDEGSNADSGVIPPRARRDNPDKEMNFVSRFGNFVEEALQEWDECTQDCCCALGVFGLFCLL
ncbi:uncharacterized protein LOC135057068 [Pseudophryne corroboree]|uniref:uncharacterized protein LOC135057068 n=1 Tax=Pseudophryne corroboree TaxID=495146 RepID=UPI0030815294